MSVSTSGLMKLRGGALHLTLAQKAFSRWELLSASSTDTAVVVTCLQIWSALGVNACNTARRVVQDAIRFEKYHWLVDSKKRPHGLIGTRPEAAVTFIDNHGMELVSVTLA